MTRSAAERRHHRFRLICKRSSRVANVYYRDPATWLQKRGIGGFAKHNLVCSCRLCRDRKTREDLHAENRGRRDEIERHLGEG